MTDDFQNYFSWIVLTNIAVHLKTDINHFQFDSLEKPSNDSDVKHDGAIKIVEHIQPKLSKCLPNIEEMMIKFDSQSPDISFSRCQCISNPFSFACCWAHTCVFIESTRASNVSSVFFQVYSDELLSVELIFMNWDRWLPLLTRVQACSNST